MSPGVRVTAAAERDLEAALIWYETQRPGLGAELLAEVSQLLKRMESSPKAWLVRYRNLRRALVKRFPFALWYQESESELLVIAVIHLRFGPRRTLKKLRGAPP